MSVMLGLVLAATIAQAPPPSSSGRVVGRVAVEGTNAPIAGARVFLFPTLDPTRPFGPPSEAVTDPAGSFAFDRVSPGEYAIGVEKAGYAPWSNGERRPTISVAADRAPDVLEIRLQKGGVIAGRVLDAAGEPTAAVHVMALRRVEPTGDRAHVLPAPMQGPQQTNDLGEFRIAGLAPGDYLVAAMPRPIMGAFGGAGQSPAGGMARSVSATTFYPGTTDQSAGLPVTVAAGGETGNINFALQNARAFRVSGMVVDEAGAPVAGAMVMMMGDPRNAMFGPSGSARTLDDGTFVIGEVVAGTYRVNASVPMVMSGGGRASGAVAIGGIASVWTSVDGTGSGNVATTSRRGGPAQTTMTEVVVSDADVSGVRVTLRRSPPQ